MNYNIISVTLLQLKSLMNNSLTQVSGVFTARSLGYLASGPVTGFIVSPSNRKKILLMHTLIMAATVALIPLADKLPMSHFVFYSSAVINGMSSGGLESILNVWLLELWGEKNSPYMQGLSFAFSAGCALSPMIAVMFVSDVNLVRYPYLIIAGTLSTAFVLLAIATHDKVKEDEDQNEASEKIKLESDSSDVISSDNHLEAISEGKDSSWSPMQRQLILLSSLFLISYSGTIIIYNQFLPTYLQSSHSMSAEKSSYITSALNQVSMAARAASIVIAFKLPPQFLLFFNLITFNIGTIFLLLFSGSGETMIWVGNMLIGCGMSGCTGPLYSFLNQHIAINNVTGSLFVFCNGLTSCIVPLVLGSLMTSYPLSLIWMNLMSMTTALVIFAVIYCKSLTRKVKEQVADQIIITE
jgi:fucose permease